MLLSTGRYILTHHHVPHYDVFTIASEGNPWICWEWLSGILFYVIYRIGGFNSLIMFKYLVFSISILVFLMGVRKSVKDYGYIYIIVPLLMLNIGTMLTIRAQMFSFLFILLEFLIILRPFALLNVLSIFVLYVFWANLHPGFFFGLVFLIPFVFSNRQHLWYIVAGIIGSLITPFNFKLLFSSIIFFISRWEYTKIALQYIGENYPLFSHVNRGLLARFLFIPVFFMLLPLFRGLKGKNYFVLGLVLIALALPVFIGMRYILFSVAIILGVIILLKERIPPTSNPINNAGMFSLLVLFSIFWIRGYPVKINTFLRKGLGINQIYLPVKGADFIKNLGSLNIFNSYGFGEYLIWKGYRVFIDGRTDIHTRKVFDDYSRFLNGDYKEVVKKYSINAIFLKRGEGSINLHRRLMDNPHWKLVYFDDICIVYLRDDIVEEYNIGNFAYLNPESGLTLDLIKPQIIKEINLAFQRSNASLVSLLYLSEVLKKQGRIKFLHSILLQKLKENGLDDLTRSGLYNLLADLYIYEKRYKEAKMVLLKGWRLQKTGLTAYNLARVELSKGNTVGARRYLLQSIKISPYFKPSYLLLIKILSREGNTAELQKVIRRVKQLN